MGLFGTIQHFDDISAKEGPGESSKIDSESPFYSLSHGIYRNRIHFLLELCSTCILGLVRRIDIVNSIFVFRAYSAQFPKDVGHA
jgi:hypothetical protein